MRRPTLSGRADLLALLATVEPSQQSEMAGLLGYEPRPPRHSPPEEPRARPDLPEQQFTPPPDAPKAEPEKEPSPASRGARATFWRCVERRMIEEAPEKLVGPEWWRRARLIRERPSEDRSDSRAPEATPLLHWPRMVGFLRHYATRWQPTRRLDEPRLVRDLTRGQPPRCIPWRAQRRWPDTLILLQDRHSELYPLWGDYADLGKRLGGLLGVRVKVLKTDDATDPDTPLYDLLARADITPEAAGSAHWLILSDLGVIDSSDRRVELWRRLIRELGRLAVPRPPFVLLPLEAGQVLADDDVGPHASGLTLVPWDQGRPLHPAAAGTRPEPPAAVDRLLALLSMAVQADPQLLRALRMALDGAGLGGGVAWELEAWNHPDVLCLLPECFLHPRRRRAYQDCFKVLPHRLQEEALALIAEHNAGARAYVRDMERAWAIAHRDVETDTDHDFLADAVYSLRRAGGAERELLAHWADLMLEGTRPDLRRRNTKLAGMQLLMVREGEREIDSDEERLSLDEYAYLFADEPTKDYVIAQRDRDIGLLPAAAADRLPPAHRLAPLRTRNAIVDVEPVPDNEDEQDARYLFPRADSKGSSAVTLRTVLPAAASGADEPVGSALLLPRASELVVRSDLEQLHLRALTRPPWAHTIGRDGNGLFVAFGAGEGERRARWWNPGRYPARGRGEEALGELALERGFFADEAELLDWQEHGFRQPEWAERAGVDDFGLWAELEVTGVAQRLRWIAPGEFLMGSPEGEPGRDDDEGPRHTVVITRGFWLLDTPVTQALWETVMGTNPSEFQSPERPVEHVSWNDAHGFIDKLNEQRPGLALRLPTEAEWEHACRAGTQTAIYTGDIEILGERNVPALDPVAWYGGNSGQDFELENGYDSSDWPEKQYPHRRAGTHPVKGKQPNSWGLYDMLGNVWEWCADWFGDYPGTPVVDPPGPEVGGRRVLRGGSWLLSGRFVRSACRSGWVPVSRHGCAGFRLARGPELRQAGQAPAGGEPGRTDEAGREGRAPGGVGQARRGGKRK